MILVCGVSFSCGQETIILAKKDLRLLRPQCSQNTARRTRRTFSMPNPRMNGRLTARLNNTTRNKTLVGGRNPRNSQRHAFCVLLVVLVASCMNWLLLPCVEVGSSSSSQV